MASRSRNARRCDELAAKVSPSGFGSHIYRPEDVLAALIVLSLTRAYDRYEVQIWYWGHVQRDVWEHIQSGAVFIAPKEID